MQNFLSVPRSVLPGAVMALRPRWILLPASLACVLFTAACGEDDDAAGEPVITQKAKPKEAPKESAGDEQKTEQLTYSYDAVNKRDPFKTYFDELLIDEQEQESLTELQRFDIDKLKLVAVVVGTATPMAMVEDPTGKGHTVKIGTLIGKRFGQVKHIRRGEIIVQEEFRDFTGKRIPVLKPLLLEKDGL